MNRLISTKIRTATSPLIQGGRQWTTRYTQTAIRRTQSSQAKPLKEAAAEGNLLPNKKKMVMHSHPTAPISSFTHRLDLVLRNRGAPKKLLQQVQDIVKEIKEKNIKLNNAVYNSLLIAYSRNKDTKAVLQTLKEMKESDVPPSVDDYNVALEAFANAGSVRDQILLKDEMKEDGKSLTTTSYLQLLRGMCNASEMELALDTLEEMKKSDVAPNLNIYSTLISTCVRLCDAPTALDLLKEAEQAGLAAENEPRIYMDVLRVGANDDKPDVINYCWEKAVGTYSMRPDEGTLLNVLRVAAKDGNTKLATDIIRQLSTSGYPYKEHYFTPLMEAFIVKKDLKSAFNVLDIMRLSGVPPSMRATLPIRKSLDSNVDAIDSAYYLLEEMKKENKTVDIAAFNVVLGACADAKDLERTVATYREASNLGVTPNVDTYNCVLEACIQTRMKGMGNVVIDEMKKSGVAPNLETYSKMISLSCTQRNYEDAFVYLEEMKSYDIIPPEFCYAHLAQKLAREKDPRFHMVLEEMETFGYNVSPKLRGLWKSQQYR